MVFAESSDDFLFSSARGSIDDFIANVIRGKDFGTPYWSLSRDFPTIVLPTCCCSALQIDNGQRNAVPALLYRIVMIP